MKITINQDKEFVSKFRDKIKDNNGFCPCSVIKIQDTKCMCKEFRKQDVSGWCHCGLYYKNMEE